MKFAYLVMLIAFVICCISPALAKTYQFVTVGSTGYYDNLWDVAYYNGYIYAVGETNGKPLIVKLDSEANPVWRIGLSGGVVFKGIEIDRDNGYIYAVGYTRIGSYTDPFIVKFDTNGKIIWQRYVYEFGNSGKFEGVTVLNGYVYAVGGIGDDAVMVKFAPNGTVLWAKEVASNGDSSDSFIDIFAYNGYVYAVGKYYKGWDAVVVKFDENGSIIWAKVWNDYINKYDLGLYDVVVHNNSIYAVGYAYNYTTLNYDAYVVKLNLSGNIVWQKRLGSSNADESFHDLVIYNNYIYAFGRTDNGTNQDAFIVKFDENGNVIWQKRIGGSGDEYIYGSDTDGVFLYAVGKQDTTSSDFNAFVIKFLNLPEAGKCSQFSVTDTNYQINDVSEKTWSYNSGSITINEGTSSYTTEQLSTDAYQVICSKECCNILITQEEKLNVTAEFNGTAFEYTTDVIGFINVTNTGNDIAYNVWIPVKLENATELSLYWENASSGVFINKSVDKIPQNVKDNLKLTTSFGLKRGM